jgi:hypothetical protein
MGIEPRIFEEMVEAVFAKIKDDLPDDGMVRAERERERIRQYLTIGLAWLKERSN